MAYLGLLMIYFQILIFSLMLNCEITKYVKSIHLNWKCNQLDEALINFKFDETDSNRGGIINVNYQYTECNKCNLIKFLTLTNRTSYSDSKTIDSHFSYKFEVSTDQMQTLCRLETYSFKECGNYVFDINKCEISLINTLPFDSDNYIYIVLLLVVLLVIFYNLGVKLFFKYKNKIPFLNNNQNKVADSSSEGVELKSEAAVQDENTSKKKTSRLQCLDTFRGLSLVLMIFVNYGSGGYKVLQHKAWHGLTIADFVFPWFLFIMGVSTVISVNAQLEKQSKSKLNVFGKIFYRSVKLFAIGIILNSRFGVFLSQLRIFGILQRISLCYLFVATLECVLYRKKANTNVISKYKTFFIDIIESWIHWLIIGLVILIWFLLTYFLPVPGCPKGYLGPGGLDEGGLYENCTGGAAGYIDLIIIGNQHLYARPTCQKIYQTTMPFDPEGILGILNSIVLTYLGAQAGKIILCHKNHYTRLLLWLIWGLITFFLFAILTFFDLANGPIPVNKNLWTLTFTLITACSSYFAILILYFIIDMKQWWNGSPIIYPGMNSIVIYFCHAVFRTTFPCQWLVSDTHAAQLFLNVWGSTFWTGVATYLFYKKIFINL